MCNTESETRDEPSLCKDQWTHLRNKQRKKAKQTEKKRRNKWQKPYRYKQMMMISRFIPINQRQNLETFSRVSTHHYSSAEQLSAFTSS